MKPLYDATVRSYDKANAAGKTRKLLSEIRFVSAPPESSWEGVAPSMQVDLPRIALVVARIAMGLQWALLGKRSPDGNGATVFDSVHFPTPLLQERTTMVQGVFEYSRRNDVGPLTDSVWWMRFYNDATFVVWIGARRDEGHRFDLEANVSPFS